MKTAMPIMPRTLSPRQSARRGRRRAQSGQALVEFSMFVIFLMYLVSGVVDIAGVMTDHLNIEYAARQGARTGSVLGNQSGSDCAIIGAVNAALSNMPELTVNKITVYQAGADGKPQGTTYQDVYAAPVSCTVSGGSSYAINPATEQCVAPGGPPNCTWMEASRNNKPFTEDSLGVKIDYTYTYQFPFMLLNLPALTSYDEAVMPVDPVALPSPAPTPTPIIP